MASIPPLPLIRALAPAFSARIDRMPLHPSTGRKRPPALRDVADLAGVSIKTVSNVVNDYPHVKDSTREKVREAILQVGYRPQVAAQQLRTGASKMVTLAVPALTFSLLLRSRPAVHRRGPAARPDRRPALHLRRPRGRAHRVEEGFNRVVGDGVIFNPLLIEEDVFARMERTTQPTVFIGEHLPEKLPQGSDYVRIDNVAAAFEATTHLLDTGRRRIAFLGAIATRHGLQPHSSGNLRRDGYRAPHWATGSPPRRISCRRSPTGIATTASPGRPSSWPGGRTSTRSSAATTTSRSEFSPQLRRLGRRVPEDIAVVGYDDTPDAPFASPPLTTISPDKHSLAATALDLLTERIQGHDGPPRILDTPYSLAGDPRVDGAGDGEHRRVGRVVRTGRSVSTDRTNHLRPRGARPVTPATPTPYEDLLREVMETGNAKGDRTGTGTRSLFGKQIRFDLAQGFPLMLTTKRVHTRSIILELAVVPARRHQRALAAGARGEHLGRMGRRERRSRPGLRCAVALLAHPRGRRDRPDQRRRRADPHPPRLTAPAGLRLESGRHPADGARPLPCAVPVRGARRQALPASCTSAAPTCSSACPSTSPATPY